MPGAVAIEQYQVVGGVIAAKTKLATATACSALWVVAQTTQPVRADAPRGHRVWSWRLRRARWDD